jgi:SAM-dependent methyltransferase
MHCNICGGSTFEEYRGRPSERCSTCGSKARHRIALDVYERHLFPVCQPGEPVLHLAPEAFLCPVLRKRLGKGYVAADAAPERYAHASAVKLVLPGDFDAFGEGHFRAILHNHVLEHIPGRYRDHLAAFARWLMPGGVMIFSVPGPYGQQETREGGEFLSSDAERLELFLQEDHLKLFGRDFAIHLAQMPGGTLLPDGVTDERRAELGVRPGKAPFFIWRKDGAKPAKSAG